MEELKKELSFLGALMIGIGGMIGVAIFVFPSTTAMLAGDLGLLAWPIAGFLLMLISYIYIEFSLRYPKSGGPVLYPYLVFGEKGKKVAGWFLSYLEGIGFSIGWIIAVTISAIVLPAYLSYILPLENTSQTLIAITIITIAGIINILGINITSKTNLALTLLLLFALGIYGYSSISSSNTRTLELSIHNMNNIEGFLASIAIAVGAYGAWVGITALAGEIKQPDKIIPKSVWGSILIVIITYTMIVYSTYIIVDPKEYSDPTVMWAPISYAASKIGSKTITLIVSLAGTTAIFTTIIVGIAALSRSFYAMGKLGIMPKGISKVNKYTGTPIRSIILAILLSSLLAISPQFFFKFIVIGLVIGTDIPYAINIIAYLYYKLSGTSKMNLMKDKGIIIGLLSFVVIGITTFNLGIQEILWSTVTLLIVLALYVALYLFKREELTNKPPLI